MSCSSCNNTTSVGTTTTSCSCCSSSTDCTTSCGCTTSCDCTTDTSCDADCGCAVEVPTECIRYVGPDLFNISTTSGSLLEGIIENIDSAIGNVTGVDGVDGLDGQGVDNVAFTSTTGAAQSEAGATDTYTVWGDSGQTLSLGTLAILNGADGTGVDHVSFTSTTGTVQSEAGATDTYTVWQDLTETTALGTLAILNGADGVGVDHVSFTSTTGTAQTEEGETDTYTVWADAAETTPLGTLVILNGKDAATILGTYNDLTGTVNTTSDLDSEIFFDQAIIANELPNDGDEYDALVYFEYGPNDPVGVTFSLGGANTFTETIQDIEPLNIMYRIKISRVSQTSQLWLIEKISYDTTTTLTTTTFTSTTTAYDCAVAGNFRVLVQNTTFGANQLTMKKATLYKNLI